MLFFLRAADGSMHYLLKDKEYSVGRKLCDILINDDQSISRKHAIITVKDNTAFVQDCGSRYHTFIDKTKLEVNVEAALSSGCSVQFGQLQSIYTFEEIPIVTTTSSIKSDQKAVLRNNINFLGGSIQQNWSSQCTHVTVEEIMLTAKVLCAIIQGIPIVKLKYWDDYANNVRQNLAPPNVANYVPDCSEVILGKNISVEYKAERKELFKNKVFVFPTKGEKAKLVNMIILAGGEAISWDTNPLTRADVKDSAKDYIILQTLELSDEKPPDSLLDFTVYYTQLGKRTIPLQEIALAIVRCSCEKDCNPDFDRKAAVLATSTQRPILMDSENILAPPTQTQRSVPGGQAKTETIIPATVDLDLTPIEKMEVTEELHAVAKAEVSKSYELEASSSMKRENESLDDGNASKKVKMESTMFLMKKDRLKKETNSNESKCETPEPSIRPLFAFKKDKISNETTSSGSANENPNPFARKRKALQGDTIENPPKKPISASDSSSVAVVASTSKSATSSSSENPFANILKSKGASSNAGKARRLFKSGPQASSTMINETANSLQIDSATILVVDPDLEKSYGWITKSVKSSPSKESIVNGEASEVDLELLRYIESFKNTVVIDDDKEQIVTKAAVTDNNNDPSVVDNNIKNFKRFKKIQPLKIQTKIIPESTYVSVICNENCAIKVVRADSEEDSDEGADTQVQAVRRRGKRYQF